MLTEEELELLREISKNGASTGDPLLIESLYQKGMIIFYMDSLHSGDWFVTALGHTRLKNKDG